MDERLRQLLVAGIVLLALVFSALAFRPGVGTRLTGIGGR